MNKSDRQKIFDKYGGRCAYCGCELSKRWNVDHVEPVNRVMKSTPVYWVHKVTGEKLMNHLPFKWWLDYERIESRQVFDKMLNPERDTVENSNPSCHSCNITKSAMSLDEFRSWIQDSTKRLNTANYNSYKFGKRYGLIQETGIEVKFYFETLQSIK